MTLHNFLIRKRTPQPARRAIERDNSAGLRCLIMSSLLLSLFVLNGCFSLKPANGEEHYYLLTGGSSSLSSPHGVPASVVRILPVEVPDFLQTMDMVVRTGSNEMVFATFHQWAEPLDAGIRRALAEDLQTSPAIREVLIDEPSPPDTTPYVISIHILASEGNKLDGQYSIRFEAYWEISQSDVSIAHGIFTAEPAPWRPGDYGDMATQLSRAVQDLARLLNEKICSEAVHSHSGRTLRNTKHGL